MGCDLHYVSESVNKHNGALARRILSDIIDVLEDDNPFKEQRIAKIVEKWENEKQEV